MRKEGQDWLYYYTEFSLVHLRKRRIAAHWSIPLDGSHAFAVTREMALFCGGYDAHDQYHLFELGRSGAVRKRAVFSLADEDGQPLVAERTFGRADSLYVLHDRKVYRCEVARAASR